MISLAEARAIVSETVRPLFPGRAALDSAIGSVLREVVTAPEDMPSFDRSAMDGYVGLENGVGSRLRVVGEITPGHAPAGGIEGDQCWRIFTGAAVPPGARYVIPQEWVSRAGDEILIEKSGPQSFIRRRGEDAKAGQVLLESGCRLGPGELSLLAQVGAVNPLVTPAARVAHFTTGDELVSPEKAPAQGQIRDSNSILIAALLRNSGAQLVSQERLADNRAAMTARLASAIGTDCDLLLISGGASVGDYDFGSRVLEELGFTVHFRQIALRPGKPLVFAAKPGLSAFVIPGNPVSHFVTYHAVIGAAVDQMHGQEVSWETIGARLSEQVPAQRDSRPTLWPVRLYARGGELRAEPLRWQSSGDLRGLVHANGLLQLDGNSPALEAGSVVQCRPVGMIQA